MKYAWVVVVLAACGGGGSGEDSDPDAAIDAGVTDAGEDSGSGIQPDALDPSGDLDGDGVLNGVDDCVDTPDPAQFDLDGDGIGWMCDPSESTKVSAPGELYTVNYTVGGATMAASVAWNCVEGTCSQAALVVGPNGISKAVQPAATWLDDMLLRGYIASENHVLWSFGSGVIGDVVAPTGTFTQRLSNGAFDHGQTGTVRYHRNGLQVLRVTPFNYPPDPFRLVEPQADGSVKTIATSGKDFLAPTVVGQGSAPVLVFGISDDDGKSLQTFTPGAASSEAVTIGGVVLDHLDSVVPMGAFGFCAEKAGQNYVVEVNNGQVSGFAANVPGDFGCLLSVGETRDHRLQVFSNGDGTFYMLDGAKHDLGKIEYAGIANTTLPAVFSYRVPAATMNDGPTYPGFVIDTDGEHPFTTTGGVSSNIAQQGNTTHFLTNESSGLQIVRYRNGVVTKVAMPAVVDTGAWKVFTTAEGAAILTTNDHAVVWPSQAASPSLVDFDNIDLLVSNGITLFIASHNAVTSQPALYSYTEVAGAPHYTALTPVVNQNVAFRMFLSPLGQFVPFQGSEQPQPTTDWFSYSKENEYCHLVRPVLVGGSVMLLGNYDCGYALAGTTANGMMVAMQNYASPESVMLSDGTTFTTVAKSSSPLTLLYAEPGSDRVMGWAGRDQIGAYVCSAAHPDRCWSMPDTISLETQEIRWVPLGNGQPDAFHLVFANLGGGEATFTSIKMVGPGNHPQPLQ